MHPRKINTYLDILSASQDHARLFAAAYQVHKHQSVFKKLLPGNLSPYCTAGQISAGILTVIAENGAVAAKLKQISQSLLLRLQQHGWKVTSFQILVQANHPNNNANQSTTLGYEKKNIKLSENGKNCLNQLAASLPDSALRDAILSFTKKYPTA